LAPLLFAISTQPLMQLLKEGAGKGELKGITLDSSHQLLFQLFADDTGIFFEATEENFQAIMRYIQVFETISGARINLEKSVLVQLDAGPEPDWFRRAGCTIARDRQVLKYLGCPVGKSFSSMQEVNYVLA
jgi:hypothetical protein